MGVLYVIDFALPLTNPVLKFLIILLIILITPILFNRIKIPHLLGLIIAGAIIGPHGFNLMERDSGIILSGTAGLLYIMFLAGLEIDINDFRKNRFKSLVFGMYTFSIPMLLGILVSYFVLQFSMITSVLLASMFASHTLIAYPLISKLGITKNKAVNITVGGTMITDILALLVLAVIVGMTTGEVNSFFWIRLSASTLMFGATVLFVFPVIARWFFRTFDDNVSQYIFVLACVFLGAFLAEIAGIEGIIGAFLSGLALNRIIPRTSPLMNRVEFVGNAIFIPFFLIGIGMLIDYRLFFQDIDTLKVAAIMIIVATSAKFLAAWFTQKTFNFSVDERRIIFGLSNAQAAATLAAVLIGYNIFLGVDETGVPIRLLNESVLNGTILMILVTCTMATFVAEKGGKNIALAEAGELGSEEHTYEEKILIPLRNTRSINDLLGLAVLIKAKSSLNGLFALNVIKNNSREADTEKEAKRILNQAAISASATDNLLHQILRYDLNLVNGITSVIRENKITDLIMGLHDSKELSDSFLGKLTEGILASTNVTTMIYKPFLQLGNIRRHVVIIPEKAEREIGFPFWINKLWNIGRNSGAEMVFYGTETTLKILKEINENHPIQCEFIKFEKWEEFFTISKDLRKDDNLIFVLSRKGKVSYSDSMMRLPNYLNSNFPEGGFILVYPFQSGMLEMNKTNLTNPSMSEPIEQIDEISRRLAKLFRKK